MPLTGCVPGKLLTPIEPESTIVCCGLANVIAGIVTAPLIGNGLVNFPSIDASEAFPTSCFAAVAAPTGGGIDTDILPSQGTGPSIGSSINT